MMPDMTLIFIGVFSLLPFLVQRFTGKYIYFVLFGLLAMLAHGTYFFGPNILYLTFVTYIISTIAELVSLKTPLYCFGVKYKYDIHNKFFSSKIRLLGVYPLEVSLTWVLLKYISFSLGLIIASAFSLSVIWEIVLIPFILVSLDFILDPVAVHVSKLWRWERGSVYFGIPWQNFLGWYLVGLASTVIILLIAPVRPLPFHYLLLLPILFYGSFLKDVPRLIRLDKRLGIVGAIPVVLWTLLGSVSLFMLYQRSM